MDTIGEVSVLLGVLGDDIREIKQDVKETKAQAIKTNGRVNKHDDEFVHIHRSLNFLAENEKENMVIRENFRMVTKDVEELKATRKDLLGVLWKILIALAGLSTIFDHFPELINRIIGK